MSGVGSPKASNSRAGYQRSCNISLRQFPVLHSSSRQQIERRFLARPFKREVQASQAVPLLLLCPARFVNILFVVFNVESPYSARGTVPISVIVLVKSLRTSGTFYQITNLDHNPNSAI